MLRLIHSVYRRLIAYQEKVSNTNPNSNFSKPVLSNEEANTHIKLLIESGKPFMLARFGAVELSCVMNYISLAEAKENWWSRARLEIIQGPNGYWKTWSDHVRLEMGKNAGLFPTSDEMLAAFAQLMLSKIKELDCLGVWNLYGEDKLQPKYFDDAILLPLESIEPYYHQNPWSKSLKGKKVLVVHPFEESIVSNYKNHDKLFENEVLPEFELKTLKAVQTIANNNSGFKTWFEAYQYMCDQISLIDFDVAIIGAGAYGFPLAAYIKEIGKQAIHMGGPTQILFGIKGSRWDDRDFFKNLYNQYWTRPLPSEVPQNFESVEEGCYW